MRWFSNNKTKTSSDYTENVKNVEIMKSAKTSENPTINYTLKGSEFEQFLNYETFLSLVKAYTDMRFIVCDECKCKSNPPSSIVEGTSSYACSNYSGQPCKKCIYPYGKFVNQGIEKDECFKFPRKITNDPCIKPEPCPPCPPEPCPPEPCPVVWNQRMRPCCVKQTKPKNCTPFKQTIPCNSCSCKPECGNPLLKCNQLC